MASKKHYSDIDVNDVCIKLEYTCNDGEGCVTVCLMNKDCVIASQCWETDAEGYMSHAKFKEALSYALGLSEARIAVRKSMNVGRPRANEEAVKTALEMYASGEYTVNKIVEKTGISYATIKSRANERGIKHPKNPNYGKRADEEVVAKAMEMYASGECTLKEISEKVGLHYVTICRKAKERGVKNNKICGKKADKKAIAEALEMYASGEYTLNEITKKVGISHTTILKRAKERGIKRQKKSA